MTIKRALRSTYSSAHKTSCLGAHKILQKIQQVVFRINPHIIAPTGTWLNQHILESEILVPGLTIIREDPSRRLVGGLTIYRDTSAPPSTIIEAPSINNVGNLWLVFCFLFQLVAHQRS